MFRLSLFRIRAFTAGNVASFLASLSRGGLMFMLIIWLQGIWLPLHGYSFSQTPLWAGIYMIPLTVGFLLAGPLSGVLADRYGARPFATGGLADRGAHLRPAASCCRSTSPTAAFAVADLLQLRRAWACSSRPTRPGIMNSLPANQRGAGAGMAGTFNSSAQVLSIGIFFTLMILGLAASLPGALYHGLDGPGRQPAAVATGRRTCRRSAASSPPSSGYNPMQMLLGPPTLAPPAARPRPHYLTSRPFFPHLIAPPFSKGLTEAFAFAAGAVPARRGGLAAAGRQVPLPGRPTLDDGRSAATSCRARLGPRGHCRDRAALLVD